jgi:hypothetical protein
MVADGFFMVVEGGGRREEMDGGAAGWAYSGMVGM